jgi:hypothetical protein
MLWIEAENACGAGAPAHAFRRRVTQLSIFHSTLAKGEYLSQTLHRKVALKTQS